MRRWLETHGILLTKSLGQTFSMTGTNCGIADAAGIEPGDSLPNGPDWDPDGTPFAQQSRHGREVDRRLVDILQERFGRESRFTLVHADALAWLRETRGTGAPPNWWPTFPTLWVPRSSWNLLSPPNRPPVWW